MRRIPKRLRAWSRDRRQRLAQRSIVRYWDWRADTHADQPGQRRYLDRWRGVFAESFPAGNGPLRILDVGSGTGFCALPLARMGHRVTAVDLSERMLAGTRAAASKEGLELEFARADATVPHLREGSFDGVVARNLLWTLPRPAEALRRWHGLLRPGGRALISDGRWNPPGRAVRRTLAGLLPGAPDRAGLRFEASYLAARRGLPLYEGLDAVRAGSLLREAGFAGVEPRHQVFDEDPFNLPDSGFFVLAADKPAAGGSFEDPLP